MLGYIISIIIGAGIGYLALALLTSGVTIFGYLITMGLCGVIGFFVYDRVFNKTKSEEA